LPTAQPIAFGFAVLFFFIAPLAIVSSFVLHTLIGKVLSLTIPFTKLPSSSSHPPPLAFGI
jgi:uncharacterized membrane protein YccF (DUF307 family)